ncbi:unnamed protein product, partial [Prorocentrum cordatum]
MGDPFGEEVAGQPPLQRARVGDIMDLDGDARRAPAPGTPGGGVTLDPTFGLGREAAAMVNSIKAALNPDFSNITRDVENVRTQLTNMSLEVDLMTTRMDSFSSRVDKTGQNVQDLLKRTAVLDRDIYTLEPLASLGKIKFRSSRNMWTFPKPFKGHKFQFQGKNLFHPI